jgi:TRAP-type C4-dicarboxylate transport system permease small subunit
MALRYYEKMVYWLVKSLAILSALGVMAMIGVTCFDIILRLPFINHPIPGAFDIVRMTGVIAIAGALPYTTAVKGHVAVEFLYHKLSHRGRTVLNIFVQMMSMGLFSFAAWQFVQYGIALKQSNQCFQTLELPIFWMPYLMAISFGVVVLVILYQFLRPNKELIRL